MFGTINLWCQLAFLAIFLTVLLISSLRPRHVDVNQLDEDAEEAEEEALFASSNGRSIGRAWNDLINRPTGIPGSIYGTTARS
ncbi:hypothetical protein KEM55_000651 [Ascosphaera atra]|nr:hypothetical protein KEM55_000651 [Ascosphaera atra]